MRATLMLGGQEGVTWRQWLDIAQTCERLGFEGIATSIAEGIEAFSRPATADLATTI